jgi:hypothetical protein
MLVRFTAWRIYSDEEHYQLPAVRTDCRSLKAHNASLKHRPSRFRGLHFDSCVPCPCFQSRSCNWLYYALCILHRPSSRMPDVWFNTTCAISFRTLSKSVAVVQVTTKFRGGHELVTQLTLIWDVTSCRIVRLFPRSEGRSCLQFHAYWRWMQHFLPKRGIKPKRLSFEDTTFRHGTV